MGLRPSGGAGLGVVIPMVTGIRRCIAALAVGAALAGCGREDGIPLTLARDDADGGFVPVDYELTSDTYKKWLVAQENLDLAGRHAAEISAVRASSPVRFVDDRPRARGKVKGGKGKGKARGRGKG